MYSFKKRVFVLFGINVFACYGIALQCHVLAIGGAADAHVLTQYLPRQLSIVQHHREAPLDSMCTSAGPTGTVGGAGTATTGPIRRLVMHHRV